MKHNYFFKLLVAIVFCGLWMSGNAATPIYLSSTGNDSNNGLSSGAAVATLSQAMTLVDAGGIINVSGVILLTSDASLTQPTGYVIAKNITIQGTSNATDGFNGNNATRFLNIGNYNVTLKNLKIINGYSGNNNGGAINISTSSNSLTCENVIFDGNKTQMSSSTKTGAAIHIDNVNGASFKNCIFSNNEASKAGAIYINNWAASSTIKFEGCAFVGNIAKETFGGSALFIRSANNNTTLNLINCTIKGNQVLNTTATGGAVNLGGKSMQSTNVNIINCTISENTTAGSADKGAGVYVLNSVNNGSTGTNNFIGNLYIKNSIIENNTAASSTYSDIGLNSASPSTCCTGLNGQSTPTVIVGIPGYVKVENSIIGKSGTTASRIPEGNIISSSYNQQSGSTLYAKLGTYNSTLNYYPLQSSSPALGYGLKSHLTDLTPTITTDQIGTTRAQTTVCDAGAIEEIRVVSLTPPTVTADADANTVDNNIDITYPSNPTWQAAITAVKIGNTTLTATTDYVISDGNIQLKPSGLNALLTVAGTKSISVVAAGYDDASVSQVILAGEATKLGIKRQLAAPASNGALLATQPQINFLDQYNNITTSTNSVTATVGAGSWTIGGTVTKSPESAGHINFVSITATSVAAVTGATITFSSGSLTPLTSVAFNIPAPPVVTSAVNASDLGLNGNSIVTVNSGGELTINQATAVNSITVAPGAKVTVLGTNSLSATNGITLQSSASGTATLVDDYTDPTITATVEQYLPQGRNWYLSSPIETNIASASNLTSAGASSVSYYSEEFGWQNDYSGQLAEGVGYVAVSSTGTNTNKISFSGKLNSGDVPVTLTRKATSGFAGYNLIANPYPSYINPMDAINANTNLEGTIWYRTRKVVAPYEYKFETVNTTSGVGTNAAGSGMVTGYIPPMQAFWVRTSADNQLFTFTNSMRDHARNVTVGAGTVPTTPLKARAQLNKSIARIMIAGSAGSDEAVVYFDENASSNFDRYDSRKMFEGTISTAPEIYSVAGSEKLVINGLNTVSYDTEIPLSFNAKETGDYSISMGEFANFESGTQIILKDKLQGNSETTLTNGVSYNFNSQVTSDSDRFSLILRALGVTTDLTGNTNNAVSVFVNANNRISINAPQSSNYAIYNAMGQLIENGILNSELKTQNSELVPGMYVVKVNNQSTRVIIK